jgi:hypothetical protein
MLMKEAGLEDVVSGIDLSSFGLTVAEELIACLEDHGPLAGRLGTYALGALLRKLLTSELEWADASFIAYLIVEHRLVGDEYYLSKLRAEYIGTPATLSGDKGIVLPPRAVDDGSEAKGPAPRYVNVCFTTDAVGKEELDSCKTLKVGQTYRLRLDIGPWSEKSIVRRPKSIEEAVGQIFEEEEDLLELSLEVALFSTDFQLDKETADGLWVSRGHLILPRQGPARTPDGQSFLLFAVNTLRDPCQAQLRLCVYFKNNLLQSLSVQAHITLEERRVEEGQWADVEYTLTANFAQVQKLPDRVMNIFVNRNRDGRHTIGLKGEEAEAILLNESRMKSATQRFRLLMQAVAYGTGSEWCYRFSESNEAMTNDQIHQDLKRMAEVGQQVWQSLIAGRPSLSEQLQEKLRDPGTIQVSLIDLNAVFPWALVYDKFVEPDEEKTQACLLWQERRDQHGNLDIAACEKKCPHKSGDPPRHNRRDLVCPYGFWGFRHIIEVPLSTQEEDDLHLEVELAEEGQPLLLFGYREEHLNAKKDRLVLRKSHEQELDQVFQIESRATKKTLEEGMQDPALRLVYFYTHCKETADPASWEPYLELGQQQPEELEPSDLPNWMQVREIWRKTRPLVFINACQSLGFTSGSLVSFLSNFAYLHASGVIGTEISTCEPLACEFAEQFYLRFVEGQQEGGQVHTLPVGEVFREVRGHLLEKHNPLGLIYTLYCSAGLEVVR